MNENTQTALASRLELARSYALRIADLRTKEAQFDQLIASGHAVSIEIITGVGPRKSIWELRVSESTMDHLTPAEIKESLVMLQHTVAKKLAAIQKLYDNL